MRDGLTKADDGTVRCWWPTGDATYLTYHDEEWGFPVDEDRRLFEKICLEGFQAGLSWLTILRKRHNFRRAFLDFDIEGVAQFKPRDITRLLKDASIIRHRGKIASVVNNARRAQELVGEFGSLAAYFWQWEPPPDTRPRKLTRQVLCKLTESPQSIAMGRDLKRRGWTFVGSTTMYAFMQSVGLVNDHLDGCVIRERAEDRRARFKRPARSG